MMVSYCNSLAMYRHQQQAHPGAPGPGWYQSYQPHPQVPQQYLSCVQDAAPQPTMPSWHHPPHHPVLGDWSPSSTPDYMHHHHHHHHHQTHPLHDHAEPILPSPPMTVSGSDMSSPSGGGTVTPPQSSGPGGAGTPGTPGTPRPLPARSPFEWMKKPSYASQPNAGKTRTKDKYRVVYSDHQRLELEKEFHYSRYITIRRKAELAASLGLSERQVKIWFQNRRAKERKQTKKREELDHKVKMEDLQSSQGHQGLQSLQGLQGHPGLGHHSHPQHALHHQLHHHGLHHGHAGSANTSPLPLPHGGGSHAHAGHAGLVHHHMLGAGPGPGHLTPSSSGSSSSGSSSGASSGGAGGSLANSASNNPGGAVVSGTASGGGGGGIM